VTPLLEPIRDGRIKALAHITGGGFSENIPRVLPKTLAADIDYTSWELPPVFRWLQGLGGMTDAELHRTFNCGIGMVAVVSPGDDADAVTAHLSGLGIDTRAIGTIQDA
jgi:phosphoribosylformylglycinamidine cyclo-ligase